VLNPEGITFLQGAYDRYDAAVQQVGYGREQLLFGVCKAYYGLATLQGLIAAAERSIDAARANHESKRVKASLQAATQLEVKRAELELAQAEARRVDLIADLERSKSTFRYLTGIDGPFVVEAPNWAPEPAQRDLAGWLDLAKKERKDLIAARITVDAASHDVDGGWTGYLPTLDVVGQAKLDNAEAQRFDDDPFSWNVIATLNLNVFDGGIREANLAMKRSALRQAEFAAEDLSRRIVNEVSATEQSLRDAVVARELAARQLEVARDTLALTEAGERAGAVTNLEVIDVNTMVFASEASFLAAQLSEAMARLDLLAAAGQPVPFGAGNAQ
jgi:outer membrane protein